MALSDYYDEYLGVGVPQTGGVEPYTPQTGGVDPYVNESANRSPEELAAAAARSSRGYNASTSGAWNGNYAIPWDAPAGKAPGSSPKYAFRDIAYRKPWGRDQLPTILQGLQAQYPQYFKGWRQVDDDKIEYDPSSGVPLNPEFGGWTGFDVIAGGDPRYMWRGYQKNGQPAEWGTPKAAKPAAPKKKPVPGLQTPKTAPPSPQEPIKPIVPGPGGTNIYDDPSTKQLVDTILQRIASLKGNVDTSVFDDYIKYLQNPSTSSQEFLQNIDERRSELEQLPWTASERDIKQTQLIDPLMRSREQLKQRYADDLMAKGHAPTSGLFTQTASDIDRAFLEEEAPIYAQLALEERNERNRRKDQRLGLSGVKSQTLEGDRMSRLADLASIIEASEAKRGIGEGRERELLSTTALLPELDERRVMLALQAFGATPSGDAGRGVTEQLMELLRMNNSNAQTQYQNQLNAQLLRQQGQQGWLGGIGQLMALLFGE